MILLKMPVLVLLRKKNKQFFVEYFCKNIRKLKKMFYQNRGHIFTLYYIILHV